MIFVEVRSSGWGPRKRFVLITGGLTIEGVGYMAATAVKTLGKWWSCDGVAVTIRKEDP